MNVDQARQYITDAQASLTNALVELEEPPLPVDGGVIHVKVGDDLAAAINGAPAGSEILVQPGTYESVVVHARSGALTIRPDTESLPAGRCLPHLAETLIQVKSHSGMPAIEYESGVHEITWIGAMPLPSEPGAPLIRVGRWDEADPGRAPSKNVFDRALLLADEAKGGKRGFETNCGELLLTRCYVDHFWYTSDSQAVCGWNGPGPFTLEDNFLSATGETVMFGGSDAMNQQMHPALAVIRGNTLTKQLAWKDKPGATVKNVLEFKALYEAMVENNIIEYPWASGQDGYLTLFTPRNQDGGAPFTQVRNITLQYNLMRHCAGGFSFLGVDNNHPSEITRNIRLVHNLIYDMDPAVWKGTGRGVWMGSGPQEIVISHNTFAGNNDRINTFLSLTVPPAQVAMTDNVVLEGEYGLMVDGGGCGEPSWIAGTTPDSVLKGNLICRGTARMIKYPEGNHYTEQGQSPLGPDYKLLPAFAGLPSTDGAPIGCDVDAVLARTGATL